MRKLTSINTRQWSVGVTAAAIAAAAALIAAMSSHADNPTPIGFKAVSASTLASDGISLLPPQAAPTLPQTVAQAAAERAFSGATREAKFAHCRVANIEPPVDSDCWAISLDPAGFQSHGPAGARVVEATYLIALIDPTSGNVIIGEDGAP